MTFPLTASILYNIAAVLTATTIVAMYVIFTGLQSYHQVDTLEDIRRLVANLFEQYCGRFRTSALAPDINDLITYDLICDHVKIKASDKFAVLRWTMYGVALANILFIVLPLMHRDLAGEGSVSVLASWAIGMCMARIAVMISVFTHYQGMAALKEVATPNKLRQQ